MTLGELKLEMRHGEQSQTTGRYFRLVNGRHRLWAMGCCEDNRPRDGASLRIEWGQHVTVAALDQLGVNILEPIRRQLGLGGVCCALTSALGAFAL